MDWSPPVRPTLSTPTQNQSFKFFEENPLKNWSFDDYYSYMNDGNKINTNIEKAKINRLKESTSLLPGMINIINDSIIYTHVGDNNTNNTSGPAPAAESESASTAHIKRTEPVIRRIPSNVSIEHHPGRTCEYAVNLTEADDHSNVDSSYNWIVDDTCVSGLCLNVKAVTLQLCRQTNPTQLSDIRLLVLNDIYVFDRDFSLSISEYCTTKILSTSCFVHYYISPLLSSGSNSLLRMNWANGQLMNDSNSSMFEPDFWACNLSGSARCLILIAELKPTEQNSYLLH
ncbi:hypothetical protein MFLAVUS_005831 [Mucor flavus]|uniref:Uncharacterized protein n=1 Tax=Mucor flavus TaxID=439312 RepID=A0ABP9YZU9_9FUNG